MRFLLTSALTLALLSTSVQAEIVATSLSQPASNVYVVIELHDELAQPDICQGRTGFPMALIGIANGQLEPIQKAGVGCWAPDGTGNVVVTALGYPNGNPLKAVKSIADFTKTDHFTDWNAAPVAPVAVSVPVEDSTATRVDRQPEGVLVTSLYDIPMPCPLGKEGRAGSVEANGNDGSRTMVNGCWVRDGAAVAFIGHMPGGDRPYEARYAASEFKGIIPSR